MPTVSFLLYLLLLAGAWLFRMAYIGWVGKYLFVCLAALPFVLFPLSLPSMLRLRLRLEAPRTVTRGGDGALTLVFDTRSLAPLSRVDLRLEIRNLFTGEVTRQRLSYRHLCAGTVTVPLPSGFCGCLDCRVTRLECRDLLGLIALRRPCGAAARCTVVPAPRAPERCVSLEAALDAAPVLRPKAGGGFAEEHELRAYQPGDTVRSIHWKLSAKVDEPIVREPLVVANNEIFLVLARVGADDRGLESLCWLSGELCRRELGHVIVGPRPFPVDSEAGLLDALCALLALPMGEPCGFDAARARCVFHVRAGEVTL